MTVDEILQNEDLRQREFPVCRHKVFLAHAAVCPLPTRVIEAVARYVQESGQDDQERSVLPGLIRETREAAARLLRAQPEEIALVGPTSLALSLVAGGFPFHPGDNVVIYFDDYPANVYPWLALAERGVEVRRVSAGTLGAIQNSDVLGIIDENTRLVALASCHFISGWRLDLPTLGRALRERGIAFCVDGIQTLGAFPTLAEDADFIAADAHKWLLGPCGAGVLYVRREWQEALRPVVHGWHNVRCPNFVAAEEIVLRTGGSRYEPGSHNLLGLVGLRAALDLILEVGMNAIASELIRKRAWLVNALQECGWQILSSDAPQEHQSGIVSCSRSGTDLVRIHEKLAAAGVVLSLRTDRPGNRYLRFSPHFYNTDGELARAVELLASQ